METAIKCLRIGAEIAACFAVAAMLLFIAGGELWQALLLVAAACYWWGYGREIKKPHWRRVAGVATVVLTAVVGTTIAYLVYP